MIEELKLFQRYMFFQPTWKILSAPVAETPRFHTRISIFPNSIISKIFWSFSFMFTILDFRPASGRAEF